MVEMYKILGWAGWIWAGLAVMFLLGYLKGERDGRRRRDGLEAKANGSDEKQS